MIVDLVIIEGWSLKVNRDTLRSVLVLDADLMVTLSEEGGVSLLYSSKHLAEVQMLVVGYDPTCADL